MQFSKFVFIAILFLELIPQIGRSQAGLIKGANDPSKADLQALTNDSRLIRIDGLPSDKEVDVYVAGKKEKEFNFAPKKPSTDIFPGFYSEEPQAGQKQKKQAIKTVRAPVMGPTLSVRVRMAPRKLKKVVAVASPIHRHPVSAPVAVPTKSKIQWSRPSETSLVTYALLLLLIALIALVAHASTSKWRRRRTATIT